MIDAAVSFWFRPTTRLMCHIHRRYSAPPGEINWAGRPNRQLDARAAQVDG